MNDLPLPGWSSLQKILFRFIFLYFGLFIFIQNNGVFPPLSLLAHYITQWLHILIPWIGKHILHLSYDITVFTNGSGDTTYDYVILFFILVLSILGTIIWSALDPKASNYRTLYYWLTVAVRFYVGIMLINYGLYKVFKLQFPDPGPYRLEQSYGNSSPMGLAWTFLGFSAGYNIFMGIAEIAAILLLFRRTMTLGAIICLMTTANVMAVNYFYDVPVKILSTALCVMTIFLLCHSAGRLYQFFFTGQPVSLPVIVAPPVRTKALRIGKYILKYGIIGYTVLFGGYQAYMSMEIYGSRATKPILYGSHHVELFVMNGDTLPPLLTDRNRWKKLLIQWEQSASVVYMNDSTEYFGLSVDTSIHTLKLIRRSNDEELFFHYEYSNDHKLTLDRASSDSLIIKMTNKSIDKDNYILTGRGFHWINEYPNNK